jgi:hypothetical protein
MNNVPWFWPGVLVSLVVGVLLAVPLGHAFRVRPLLAALLLVSFGSILAATLTPLRDALEFGAVGTGVCDFSRVGPPPRAGNETGGRIAPDAQEKNLLCRYRGEFSSPGGDAAPWI